MNKGQLRELVIDAGRAVLIARSGDPQVRREVAALLGRLDDDLSDEQVLEGLKELRRGAPRSAPLMKKHRAKKHPLGWKLKQRLLRLSQ